ncbi:Adenosine deaminase-like protein [Termitomyces sp. T112]|nr:Adenosine deaminase-like protein [Termitomyces sp. T112]
MMAISGPAGDALKALTSEQIAFLQNLPKAELHAHLNGSIPISVLQELARQYRTSSPAYEMISNDAIQAGIDILLSGPTLNELHDFFDLFPAIYALMTAPPALACAVRAVLSLFLDGEHPQCTYLELRTTPKVTPEMSREEYLRVVLDQIKVYGTDRVGLIVSMDRKMGPEAMHECVELAKSLKMEGEPVVGVDLCGDPTTGDPATFRTYFKDAKEAGLGITLHIAETMYNTSEDTLQLLSFSPDRLGHATFLDDEAKKIVAEKNPCIEICLSSNLLCKTVPTLEAHHIRHYLKHGHPIAICTDDILPFHTSLLGEYALLLAPEPLGLGLSEEELNTESNE